MYLILIIILIVLLIGGLPSWPYSARLGWGWGPSGLIGVLVIVLLVLLLTGRL